MTTFDLIIIATVLTFVLLKWTRESEEAGREEERCQRDTLLEQ